MKFTELADLVADCVQEHQQEGQHGVVVIFDERQNKSTCRLRDIADELEALAAAGVGCVDSPG